jgi:glycosyltransferase involved in cell wall biosynthesis
VVFSAADTMASWIILTGEYPPKIGGVAAYTQNLAIGLARAGDEVEVWAPSPKGELAQDPGVRAHLLPDHFGPRSLVVLERELAKRPDARILVQYVPHVFGMRAMNVPFVVWLAARRRPFWVMVHEVAVGLDRRAPWRHNVLAAVTQGMAALLARRAERLFVSTTAWNRELRRLAPGSPEPVWIPIPSNVPESVSPEEIVRARTRLGLAPDDVAIGTFGTFGLGVGELLEGTLKPLLARDPRRVAIFMGRGSADLAVRAFGAERSQRDGSARAREPRVIASGELELDVVAANLAACAAVLQPYPDGVTSRRTSAMAGLALGVPLITNAGALAEPFWGESGAVALAPEPSADGLLRLAEEVLTDPTLRATLGTRGKELYRQSLSLDRGIRALREEP